MNQHILNRWLETLESIPVCQLKAFLSGNRADFSEIWPIQ